MWISFSHVNLTQSLIGNPSSFFANPSTMFLWDPKEMPKIYTHIH